MQDKLQLLAGKHVDVLETLSPEVRKRVEVLRDIQVCSHFFMFVAACFWVLIVIMCFH